MSTQSVLLRRLHVYLVRPYIQTRRSGMDNMQIIVDHGPVSFERSSGGDGVDGRGVTRSGVQRTPLRSFCRASSTVRPGTSKGSMPVHPEQFVDVVKATLSIRSRFRLHSR